MKRIVVIALFVVVVSAAALTQTGGDRPHSSEKIQQPNFAKARPGGTDMDKSWLDTNRALIRRLFEEEINHQDLRVLEGMVSADYVSHNDSVGPTSDLEQTKKFLANVFAAFPDIRVTIEDMITEGDKVVVRNTWRGTFRGPWMGIAPTGKEVTWTGIVIWRITDGKIRERWANINFPEVMQKIAAAQTTPIPCLPARY